MIHANTTPLTNEQALQIHRWMSDPAAEMYRSVLLANLAICQLEAGKDLIEGKAEGNQQAQAADQTADRALLYHHALTMFDTIKTSSAGEMFNVTFSLQPPPKIAETP